MPKVQKFVSFIEKIIDEVSVLDCSQFKRKFSAKVLYTSGEQENVTQMQPHREKYCLKHKSASHDLFECKAFLGERQVDRDRYVKDNRLCFGCLKPHLRKDCSAQPKCNSCSGRHLSVMHNSALFNKKNQSQI